MSKVRKRNGLNLERYKRLKTKSGTNVSLGTRSFARAVAKGAVDVEGKGGFDPAPYTLSSRAFLVLLDFWFSFDAFVRSSLSGGMRDADFRLSANMFVVFCAIASSGVAGLSVNALSALVYSDRYKVRSCNMYVERLVGFGLVVRSGGVIRITEFGDLFVRDSVTYNSLRDLSKIVKSVL